MPSRKSEEREQEYAELGAFMSFWSTHVHRIDAASPSHPVNVLHRIAEKYGTRRALEGLRQAVNDTIEDTADYPRDTVWEMDRILGSVGLVSLSELRRRYSSQYRRILRNGLIRNDTEYYLIAGILADTTSRISDAERAALEEMSAAYGGST